MCPGCSSPNPYQFYCTICRVSILHSVSQSLCYTVTSMHCHYHTLSLSYTVYNRFQWSDCLSAPLSIPQDTNITIAPVHERQLWHRESKISFWKFPNKIPVWVRFSPKWGIPLKEYIQTPGVAFLVQLNHTHTHMYAALFLTTPPQHQVDCQFPCMHE